MPTTQLLIGFLLRNVHIRFADLPAARHPAQIADLFRNSLLNPAAASFDSVRLIDRNGQGLVNTTLRRRPSRTADESRSRRHSAPFRARSFRRRSSAVAVSQTTAPVVEIVNTIYWRDGTPLGYVVATLNNGRIFFNNMRVDDTTANDSAYTFLTTPQGVVLAPPRFRRARATPNLSSAVSRALSGQNGTSTYTANDGLRIRRLLYADRRNALRAGDAGPDQCGLQQYARTSFRCACLAVGGGVLVLLIAAGARFQPTDRAAAIKRLRLATQALSDGNFDVEVRDAQRGDEIGRWRPRSSTCATRYARW